MTRAREYPLDITPTGDTRYEGFDKLNSEMDRVFSFLGEDEKLTDGTGTVNVADIIVTNDHIVNLRSFPKLAGEIDDFLRFQRAVDSLISSGGGILFIPNGDYTIIADNPTVANPKRIAIRGYVTGEVVGEVDNRVVHYLENIHIVGDKNTVIKMEGITADYLNSIDDIASSGRDVFTVFSFCYAKNCSVSNLTFQGEHQSTDAVFRYQSPRAKAIGFFGSSDCYVCNVKAYNIFGNFINSTPADSTIDGYWMPCSNLIAKDCIVDTTWENGINHMGGTMETLIDNCKFNNCANGMETGGRITNNLVTNCGGGICGSSAATISNNTVIGCTTGFMNASALSGNPLLTTDIVFANNIVRDCKGPFTYIYPGNGNIIIANNRFIESNLEDGISYNKAVFLPGTPDRPIKNVSIIDNYFEIKKTTGFCNSVIHAVSLQDSIIANNTINTTLASITTDIYYAGLKNTTISGNKTSKTIGVSSDNTDRNLLKNNSSPLKRYPVETDYLGTYLPVSGDWVVGDIIKTTPTATAKGPFYNIDIGYECVTVSPLTWRKIIHSEIGEWATAVPNSGTWVRGRRAHYTSSVLGGNLGWVCTASGTFGTLNGSSTTGSILTGTTALTVNSLTGLALNSFITISGVSGVKKIVAFPLALAFTTVDEESISGQSVLKVAATTNFRVGDTVSIGRETANSEAAIILSIQTGVSLTLTTNLANAHAVGETVTNCVVIDAAASATVTGAAVAFSAPTFAACGIVDLQGSIVWDPGSLADGAGETSAAITAAGAALGDFVLVSAPYDLQGICCNGYVSGTNAVKIRIQNETGGVIDLASGTWKVKVIKQ